LILLIFILVNQRLALLGLDLLHLLFRDLAFPRSDK